MPTEYPIPDFDRLTLSGPKLTLRRMPQPIDLLTRLLFAALQRNRPTIPYRLPSHVRLCRICLERLVVQKTAPRQRKHRTGKNRRTICAATRATVMLTKSLSR